MSKSFLSLFIILFLSCRLVVSSTRSYALMFDLSKIEYQRSKQWTRVKIGVQGGQGNIKTMFDQYPTGWRYVDDSCYIPKSSLTINRRYPLKIRIIDQQGNQARASIVYNIKNGRVVVTEQLYSYDKIFNDDFFNSDGFQGRPSMIRSGSYYETNSNIDMSKNKLYIPKNQLQTYRNAVNRLQSVSKTAGSGLDDFYRIYRGNNINGTFSLTNFLDSLKKVQTQKESSSNSNVQNNEQNTGTQQNINTFSNIDEGEGEGNFQIQGQEENYSGRQDIASTNSQMRSNRNRIEIFTNGRVSQKIRIDINTNSRSNTKDFLNFSKSVNSFTNNIKNNIFRNVSGTHNRIDNNKQQIDRTRDQVYTNFPSTIKIDQLILTADLSGFSKLIQQVSKISTLSCQQKASYLSVFLGRIQSAISMKKFSAEQLQVLKEAAQTNYNLISEQIKKNQQQSTTLDLLTLKQKINVDLTKLKNLYSQFNKIDANNEPAQLKIRQLKRNIQLQKSKSLQDREELTRQKLAYNQADALVQRYQKLLNEAKSTKNVIVSSIQKLNSDITQIDSKIVQQEKNIGQLEVQVTTTRNNLDSLKIEYTNLETTVERYRSDISKFSKKQTQLLTQIANLQERLKIERKKIVTDQQVKLSQMISGLQRTLPTISEFIDDNYYKCFQANNLQTVRQDSKMIYIVAANDFQNYIQNAYQLQFDSGKVKLPTSVKLRPLSLLDSTWESSFGVPYDIISYSSTKDYSFNSDFNCLNPSSLVSGSGIINSIGNRFIEIDTGDGTIKKLNLGPCTRLQSTSFLPTVGQNIFWRGMPSSIQGQFNTYRASCI